MGLGPPSEGADPPPSLMQSRFSALNISCAPPVHAPTAPPNTPTPGTTGSFTLSKALPFPECPGAGIIQYKAFSDWLLSRNRHLRFLHVISGFVISGFVISLQHRTAFHRPMHHGLRNHPLWSLLWVVNYEHGCYKYP